MKTFLATSGGVFMTLLASLGVASKTASATVLPEWAERLGWTLVHSVWQLAAIAFVAALVDLGLKRRSANARYAVGVAALLMMVAAPCVTWTLVAIAPHQGGDGLPKEMANTVVWDQRRFDAPAHQERGTGDDGGPAPEAGLPHPTVVPSLRRRDVSQGDHVESYVPSTERRDYSSDRRFFNDMNPTDAKPLPTVPEPTAWSRFVERVRLVVEPQLPLFVALWFAGVAFCSLRPVWGLWTQWRLRRVGLSPVSDELQRTLTDLARRMGVARLVRIAQSACVDGPMVVGYLKPMILLPASVLTGLTPVQLESLLAHELAHVRRHDWLVNAMQVVVETLLFYHPAVWWLSRRIRDERELCCDDIALTIVGDRATYGRMLLALEELRHANPIGSLVTPATMAATGGSLVARIRRLMPVPREMERTQRGWLSGTMALVALAVSCGVWFATHATAENGDLASNEEAVIETDKTKVGDSADKAGQQEQSSEERASSDSASGRRRDQTTVEPDDSKLDSTGDPQMLAWGLVVDGTLADSVAKLGSHELPQQGAYRIIRLDAARVRQALFDPVVKDHVFSDLMPPQALRLSESVDDRQSLHWSPHFLIKPNVGAVHGLQVAEYLSIAGQPFDIQFRHVSFGLYAFGSPSSVNYEINQKSLNFRGDMPIGSAVAFIGKAESAKGKRDFREVLVFEAVPKLNEQAERLLRDVTWFKAGREREKEALQHAEAFNARAARMPDELPARWTKPLPHGGSVSLVAVARPATHPFCWWDPDGNPRSTDWPLQQHAFGTGELVALVCIRDPNVTELERQGVSYMVTGRNPPLPLYRPWSEAAPKEGRDDSELFLFSVYNTDDEQRPMIGINSGVGPWKELGKLTLKEEVTYGRADYLLGGMDRGPDQTIYRTLGRRYLPDEDIRLRLIDKQGKSNPFDPNMFQSSVSDSRGIPFGWDGWSAFQSQQLKEKDLDHVVLDSRSRHWMTFTGFASELTEAKGDEPPKLTVAPPAVPAPKSLAALLSHKFNALLQTKYSNFFNDDDRASIADDLKRFTERHQPATLSAERASAIVSGLDNVLYNNVDYLGFFPTYRSLKWRLWMALNPRDLSPEEVARREHQREEMRKQIREIPITDFHIVRTHGHTIDELERLFENPWHDWFHEPLSDKELAGLRYVQKRSSIPGLVFAARHFDSDVAQVRKSVITANPLFGADALPLDAEAIAKLKPGRLQFHARYATAEAFYGIRDLVFDEPPQSGRRILDWSKTFVDLPETSPPGLEATKKWAEENQTGLLAYESARHGLFMLRGAKLGLLPVETWHEADRLSDDELFRIVGEQAKDSILLADHYGPRPKERGYGPPPPGPLLVVESASGELGVVRVESISNNGITAHLRIRPGAKRRVVAQAAGRQSEETSVGDSVATDGGAETPAKDIAKFEPQKGLEFLAAYPELSDLSLNMSEAKFRAIVRKGHLALQSSYNDDGQWTYSIPTGDGHTIVVTFQRGTCTGMERKRGEDRAERVTFDSLDIRFGNSFGSRQPEQIQIKADGACVYHIDGMPARGNEPKWPEARLNSKLRPQTMLELERLLAKSDWLKKDSSEQQDPPRHSEEIPITVVRGGQTVTVKCVDPRDETYRSLLRLLYGIAKQEHLVYTLDWVGVSATNRKLLLIDLRFGIEALEGRPGRALPHFDFDYDRFVPTFTRKIRHPSIDEEDVLTAITLLAFVRAEAEFDSIAKLKNDRFPNIRSAVARAVADFGGERALPILIEMVPSTAEARWSLVRMGDMAVPSVVKLIVPGKMGDETTAEDMVRAYLDHRAELTGPIDERVVTAAREALKKTAARFDRTQYFKEFLQLAEQRQAV